MKKIIIIFLLFPVLVSAQFRPAITVYGQHNFSIQGRSIQAINMIPEAEQPFVAGDSFQHGVGCAFGTVFFDICYSEAFKWLNWENTEATEYLAAVSMYGVSTLWEINQTGNYWSYKDHYWNVVGITAGFLIQKFIWDGTVLVNKNSLEQKLEKEKRQNIRRERKRK